jgi:O-antigen/teichoic acid export membrane protein
VSQTASASKPPPALSPFWNLVWNAGSFVVAIVVTFFLAPFLIRSLGDGPYGMLALIGELTGYYGILDLGMRTAVSYFVARGVARNDVSSVDDTMHNAFWLLVWAGGVIAAASVVVVWAAPYWFKIEGLTVSEARTSIAVMSATFALSLPASVFGSALYGLRRLDMVNGLGILVRLGSVIPTILLLRAGGGLVSFVVLQGAISLLRWMVEAWMVRSTGIAHNLVFPIRWNRSIMRDCISFGMGNTVINISQMVANQLDLVVIATFLGTSRVTAFYLGRTICSYYADLISTITRTFTPHITHLHASGQSQELLDFYLRVSRLAALLSTWLMVGILAYGRPFLTLWVGESYVTGEIYNRSDIVLYVMVTGLFFRTLQSMAWQVLMGSRELRFLTWINVAEAASNLSLSLLLVRPYGLLGVAAGTAIPMWICYGLVMPAYVVGKYEVGWRIYIQAVVRPVVFTCVVFGLICWLVERQFYPHTWLQLFGSATVASLIHFICTSTLELTRPERQMIAAKIPFLHRLAPAGK